MANQSGILRKIPMVYGKNMLNSKEQACEEE